MLASGRFSNALAASDKKTAGLVTDKRDPLEMQADVLVVGGGAAGVAAASTAARQGLKVILMERYGFCGGAAVAGMSGTICGAYLASNDPKSKPEILVYGFLNDFITVMESKGGLTPPVRYGKTFVLVHDPAVWRDAADDILQKSGVQILYHTTVTDALLEGKERVAGVVAYTKQGKLSVRAKVTIDASGDADVTAMCGFKTFMGLNGVVQNPTMFFRIANVDMKEFLAKLGEDTIVSEEVQNLITNLNQSKKYFLPRSKIFLFPTPRAGEVLCNATRLIGRDGRELNPIYVEDITEAEIQGRIQVREYARFLKDYYAGCQNSYLVDTGAQVGIRQTRQIEGIGKLRDEDVEAGKKRKDGVVQSPWPIEMHKGDKPKLVWLIDDYYEIPYAAYVPDRGESLLVAGRCLSAEHAAMASARVTAQCFASGHAVGHAASVAVKEKVSPRAIKGEYIRDLLMKDGARFI
jgi:hypothetical protein